MSLKQISPLNQISHISTKVDPIRSSPTWKKSEQICICFAFQHIKTNFPRNTRSTNGHDQVYKWSCHTSDKTKSIPLARQSQDLLKISGKFLVFPSVIKRKGVFTPKGLPSSKHGSKTSRDNKSTSWNDKLDLDV